MPWTPQEEPSRARHRGRHRRPKNRDLMVVLGTIMGRLALLVGVVSTIETRVDALRTELHDALNRMERRREPEASSDFDEHQEDNQMLLG